MGQIIQRFRDGAFLEYDRGSFDDWCVYLTEPSGSRKPPRDGSLMEVAGEVRVGTWRRRLMF